MKKIGFLFYAGLMALALMLSGCTTTCDALGDSELCQIHHEFMHPETVTNKKHWPPVSQAYVIARAQHFPHAYPFILPQKCDKCLVYICDDCLKAEEQWRMQHPGAR